MHCARECVIGLERRTDEGHAGASRSPSSVQPEGCLHQLVSNRPRFKASVCGHRSPRVFTECLIHVNRCQHRSVVRAVSLQRFASSFRVLPASGERCHRVPLIPYTAHVARIVPFLPRSRHVSVGVRTKLSFPRCCRERPAGFLQRERSPPSVTYVASRCFAQSPF